MADKEADVSWAMKLLTVNPETDYSILGQYGGTIGGVVLGLITAVYVNYAGRRPLMSGIQKHISFPIIGGCVARYFELRAQDHLAERDAVYRHYINLHPQDFPAPERRKYSEILREWIPIR